MTDDTWPQRAAARAELNKWKAALQMALQNRQRDQFESGFSPLGIRLIAGVAPRVLTWGDRFPFNAAWRAAENDNRFPDVPDAWSIEWDSL